MSMKDKDLAGRLVRLKAKGWGRARENQYQKINGSAIYCVERPERASGWYWQRTYWLTGPLAPAMPAGYNGPFDSWVEAAEACEKEQPVTDDNKNIPILQAEVEGIRRRLNAWKRDPFYTKAVEERRPTDEEEQMMDDIATLLQVIDERRAPLSGKYIFDQPVEWTRAIVSTGLSIKRRMNCNAVSVNSKPRTLSSSAGLTCCSKVLIDWRSCNRHQQLSSNARQNSWRWQRKS
jgi:hypothetical protein